MELKLTNVSVCEFKKQVHTRSSVDADVIVPDTKPDIFRIMSVKAYSDMNERYMRKDKVIYSGNVRFNILYAGEMDKKRLHVIEYTAPFNFQTDVPGIDEQCVGMMSCTVCKTDFQIKNSRKLSVSAVLNFEALISKQHDISVIEDAEGDDCVPVKYSDYEYDCMKVCKEIELPLSERFCLPAASGAETDVYDVDARIEIPEIKTVNNKAVIKGNGKFTSLCMTDGEISTYENELSFTEICDLDGVSPDMTVSMHFDVADCTYTVENSDDETGIEVHYKLRGYICAWEHMTVHLADDIYDPDYTYTKKETGVILMRNQGPYDFQTTLKDIASLPDSEMEIKEIHFMNAVCECSGAYISGMNICDDVTVHTEYIYTDSSGSLAILRKDIPYKLEIPVKEEVAGDLQLNTLITNYGYTLYSSSEIQSRIILKAQVSVWDEKNVSLITDFARDTSAPIDKSTQPSIAVCYPSGNETLWNLAKKYNTTTESIACINGIDTNDYVPGGKPLIISRRKAQNV